MESVITHHLPVRIVRPAWKSNSITGNNRAFFFSSKTLIAKPTNRLQCLLFSSLHPSPLTLEESDSARHTTLLVESYHEHQRLRRLLQRLDQRGSCALRLLEEDGDWTKDHFWAVVRFFERSSRFHEILQVFGLWKNIEKSRINEFNYERIICLLCREGMMDEALQLFQEMKNCGLNPTLEIYNSVIHGYATNGNFDDAMLFLNQMKDDNLSPETDTYDGLIKAYGKYKMYDEIGMCLKRMESDGCSPDHNTYNLLIREFSRGGLLKRMERVYQSLMSRRLTLQPSTLVSMLEAYAEFRILEKMEKTYIRVLNFKICLNEDLVRKLAKIYIDNHMFSRLDDLGLDLSSRNRKTDLVWCLRLLSHARVVSRKGLDSVVREMEELKISWNTTFANIILLAYSKMKDSNNIKIVLSELRSRHVEPDIVTVGIVFDSNRIGFDRKGVFMTWKRMGYLNRAVEMNTDPLVLTAFGKGQFLRSCEEVFCSLDPKARESRTWTYQNLIDLVVKHSGSQVSVRGN